jgi:hypothetical protein
MRAAQNALIMIDVAPSFAGANGRRWRFVEDDSET